jgi:hypothetical protein
VNHEEEQRLRMKKVFLLIILIGVIAGILIMARGRTDMSESVVKTQDNVQIILYKRGQIIRLNEESPYFEKIVSACERLFTEADDTLLLIMTGDRIRGLKKQVAIELLYPTTQTKTVLGQTVYFTKLFIPLSGEFSNGMIFYAGAHASEINGQPEYDRLLEYGATTFVRNTHGIQKLKEALQESSIVIN